jgi:hypothetical protein
LSPAALYSDVKSAAGDNWNGWLPYDVGTLGENQTISTVSSDADKVGASVILDTFGDIDIAFNVDHYIGSGEADIFFGSSEDDTFDAATGTGNFMSGGAGDDKLIVKDYNDGDFDNLDLSKEQSLLKSLKAGPQPTVSLKVKSLASYSCL